MQSNVIKYVLLNAVTPVAITSSTDATPIVITATAHGFVTGDKVLIYGHTTNVAANGVYKVTRLSSSTFSLQDLNTGASIAGSGAGAGSSGICMVAPKIPIVGEFKNAILQVGTTGTATTTVKVAGSVGLVSSNNIVNVGSCPNFGGTVSPTNPYTFLQIINLDTGAAVNGATGIVVAGTDINNQYEVNINAMQYLTVIPISWTAGAITVTLLLTSAA